ISNPVSRTTVACLTILTSSLPDGNVGRRYLAGLDLSVTEIRLTAFALWAGVFRGASPFGRARGQLWACPHRPAPSLFVLRLLPATAPGTRKTLRSLSSSRRCLLRPARTRTA